MRIALLTQYYPPEAGAPQRRLSDLARRLAARGHTVQVLTALPNYPGDHILPGYTGLRNSVAQVGPVRVARVGLYVAPLHKTIAQRIRSYVSFAGNVAWHGRRLLEPMDVILMESPPLTIAPAGVLLGRAFDVPVVCNVSDVWPQSAIELGMLPSAVMRKTAEWLERWTYRHSAALSGQTRGICAHLSAMAPQKPVHFFPNGVDLEAYAEPVRVQEIRARFGWAPDEFIAGYTGLFGHAQALEQLVEAAGRLGPASRIRIALFGDGPCRDALMALARSKGIPEGRLTFYGPQPPDAMPAIQRTIDAGIVPLADKPIFAGARPSKMLEVMAAGKPVVYCGTGEGADLIRYTPFGLAGIVVPAEAPGDLATALERLAADRALAATLGRAGQQYVRRDFDRESIAGSVEAFLIRVVQSRLSHARES